MECAKEADKCEEVTRTLMKIRKNEDKLFFPLMLQLKAGKGKCENVLFFPTLLLLFPVTFSFFKSLFSFQNASQLQRICLQSRNVVARKGKWDTLRTPHGNSNEKALKIHFLKVEMNVTRMK